MIDKFFDEYSWLSNFYQSDILLGGIIYPTAEHAYQANKVLDADMRIYISKLSRPGLARRVGQQVQLRWDWGKKLSYKL
jgi:hypothetical protein